MNRTRDDREPLFDAPVWSPEEVESDTSASEAAKRDVHAVTEKFRDRFADRVKELSAGLDLQPS